MGSLETICRPFFTVFSRIRALDGGVIIVMRDNLAKEGLGEGGRREKWASVPKDRDCRRGGDETREEEV